VANAEEIVMQGGLRKASSYTEDFEISLLTCGLVGSLLTLCISVEGCLHNFSHGHVCNIVIYVFNPTALLILF
jgi:hypothetical protein